MIFCFSTALAVWYMWYLPILNEARDAGVTNSLVSYPKLGHVVYILVSVVIAPVLLIPLISTSAGESFARGLRTEIFRQD